MVGVYKTFDISALNSKKPFWGVGLSTDCLLMDKCTGLFILDQAIVLDSSPDLFLTLLKCTALGEDWMAVRRKRL